MSQKLKTWLDPEHTNHINLSLGGLNENQRMVNGRSAEQQVFENPMLLENILVYLIHNKDLKISQKMLQTTRLVRKSWLKATTTLLKKSVKPVVELALNAGNSLGKYDEVKRNGKHLDQFVSTFGNSSRFQDSKLPFKLNLNCDYFREENQQSLSNCFVRLGHELMELQVTFPKNGCTMPLIFPRFTFPFLKKLSFQFSHEMIQQHGRDGTGSFNDCHGKGVWLLQLILNASELISDLTISWAATRNSNNELVPTNLEYLQLPASLQSLEFKPGLDTKGLEITLRNDLPKLKLLALEPSKIPLENDMLFKILDRFRKTLTGLRISGNVLRPHSENSINLEFPVMEKLDRIYLSCLECELNPQPTLCLRSSFPKLEQVSFIQQTEASVMKWIQDSQFENVDGLMICLANNEFRAGDPNYFASISFERIQRVHSAFPNVAYLTLTLNIGDMNCLKYLFKNMMKLKSLKIVLRGNFHGIYRHVFDSSFLGIPPQLAAALTENAQFVRSVELEHKKGSSIVDLTDLRSFTLWITKFPFLGVLIRFQNYEMSILSDLVFTEGFLKMPKLRTLRLIGQVKASPKMIELWKNHDRNLEDTLPGLPPSV